LTPDDLLRQATRDLRRLSESRIPESAVTRARVLSVSARRWRRRQWLVSGAFALLALVTMSTVWAAATGRLSSFLRVSSRGATTPREPRIPPPAARIMTSMSRPEPPSLAVAAEPAGVAHEPGRRRARLPLTEPKREPEREDELFKSAYHDQFVVHDSRSALTGWDAYLLATPAGRFALEATYNRAICLVRLDRRTEAIAALTPFAEGAHGDYRRREARELIDALSGETAR
jgi:hypothetical protein